MGCWNGSCFFSGLAINWEDPVVAFPMTSDMKSSILFPVHGTYNDYGSIENVHENELTRRVLDIIQKHLVDHPYVPTVDEDLDFWVTRGKNYKDRVQAEEGISSTENLFKAFEREECCGEVISFTKSNKTFNPHFILVHGTVWEQLKTHFLTVHQFYNWRTGNEQTGQESLDLLFEGLFNPDDDGFVNTFSYIKDEESRKELQKMESLRNFKTRLHEAFYLQRACFCINHVEVLPFSEIHRELMNQENCQYVEDLKSALTDWWVFNMLCETLRRVPQRSASKGSQNDDYDMVEALCHASLKAISDRKRKYAEWEEEEEEDDE